MRTKLGRNIFVLVAVAMLILASITVAADTGNDTNLASAIWDGVKNVVFTITGFAVGGADTDSDGVIDSEDNCPTVANPDQNDSDSPLEGLKAYWKFEDGAAATTAADSSGNGWTGTLNNYQDFGSAEWKSSGKVNGAFEFMESYEGRGYHLDTIYLDPSFGLNSNEFTIMMWVKPYDYQPYGSSWTVLFSDWTYCCGTSFHYNLRNGVFELYLNGGPSISGSQVALNQWTHTAATFDNGNLILYQNGQQVASGSGGSSIAGPTSAIKSIGGKQTDYGLGDLNYPYEGMMDEIAVFDRALSPAEINQMYTKSNNGEHYDENLGGGDGEGDACDCNDGICDARETGYCCSNQPYFDEAVCGTCPTDADGDGISDPVDNCPDDYNPDQDNTDSQDGGDACDVCPDDPTDTCDPQGSAGDYVVESTGGTVTTSDGGAEIDIPAGALQEDTSVSITEVTPAEANVGAGINSGALKASYSMTPDGATFDSAVTVSLVATCTKGCTKYKIWVYNTGTSSWEAMATSKSNVGSVWTYTAQTTHFTEFALVAPLDSDNDGYSDSWYGETDNCPLVANPAQIDTDGNGKGDACDCYDGFCDSRENRYCVEYESADPTCVCSDLEGLQLPDSSWGISVGFNAGNGISNGLVTETTCGNYDGTMGSFTGTIETCKATVCDGYIEICKDCSSPDSVNYGFKFLGVNLAPIINEDWSSAFIKLGDKIGVLTSDWTTSFTDKIYGSSEAATEGAIVLNLLNDKEYFVRYDQDGTNEVDLSSESNKLTNYIWNLPGSYGFGLYDSIACVDNDKDGICNNDDNCMDVYNPAGCSNNVVAYYQFEEGYGTTVSDSTGNGRNGYISDSNFWSEGYFGNGLYISSNSAAVQIPEYGKYGNEFTVSLWHKVSDYNNDWKTLLSKEGGNYHYLLYNPTYANILGIYNEGWYPFTPYYSVPDDGQWHHIAVIYHASSAELYVDGTYRGSTTTMFESNSNPLGVIGGCISGGCQASGYMDEVIIYNNVLTPSEILEQYYTGGHYCEGSGDGQADSDSDNVGNACDNCIDYYNPDQSDVDSDGEGDVCDFDIDNDRCLDHEDIDPYVYHGDSDNDGKGDDCDNCIFASNPDQYDSDNDGLGNTCDDCPYDHENDIDSDGICGNNDNCRYDYNPGQSDDDNDGLGFYCDSCPNDHENDYDNDWICGNVDNCRYDSNPLQTDSDSDGSGDVCDNDDDNDGVIDEEDNCQFVSNPDQVDSDSSGSGGPLVNVAATSNGGSVSGNIEQGVLSFASMIDGIIPSNNYGWAYNAQPPGKAVFRFASFSTINQIQMISGWTGDTNHHPNDIRLEYTTVSNPSWPDSGNWLPLTGLTFLNSVSGGNINGNHVTLSGQKDVQIGFDPVDATALRFIVYGSDAGNENAVTQEFRIFSGGIQPGDGVGDACDCDDEICDGREIEYCTFVAETPDPICPDAYCSNLEGLKLPDSSWGIRIGDPNGNGINDLTCGNYNGLDTSFNGIISDCTPQVCNGFIEICKDCSEPSPTKYGFKFFGINLAPIIDNDWSLAFRKLFDMIGITTSEWTAQNGFVDKIYSNGLLQSSAEITLLKDGTKLYHYSDEGTNEIDVTSTSTKVTNYMWSIPYLNSYEFGLYNAPECIDNDGDGFGLLGNSGCTFAGVDCDDSNPSINPGANDNECDGIDQNCDSVADNNYVPTSTSCGEGICSGNSGELQCVAGEFFDTCDPYEGAVPESCEDDTGYDGLDSNCDGEIDLDCTTYCDEDSDGYTTHFICLFIGKTLGDCDDTNADINPGATEVPCNDVDENCESDDDEGTDNDNDGFKIDGGFCGDIDCNDDVSNIYPGAIELCDGIDNDCDNVVPADEEDFDLDGYKVCENDCDDTDSTVNPGAQELCDGIDNNCDNSMDFEAYLGDLDDTCGQDSCEGTDTYFNYYCDEGAGCATEQLTQDNDVDGFNGLCTDCNDNDDGTYPGVQELCPDNGIDNNCDGQAEFDCNAICDADNDGWWDDSIWYCVGGSDCDDMNANINPAAEEICDGIDNNCDDDSGWWRASGQTTANYDNDPNTGIDNRDTDGDAVDDCLDDRCLNTVLPEEGVPTRRLLFWHYANIDTDNIFETSRFRDIIDSNYNLTDTFGCSCEQILECKPGKNRGEYKFGCSKGTMWVWTNQRAWAPDCQWNFPCDRDRDGYRDDQCKRCGDGEVKPPYTDTDDDGTPDTEDTDDDNDGIDDEDDAETESEADEDDHGKGKPRWWCKRHPSRC